MIKPFIRRNRLKPNSPAFIRFNRECSTGKFIFVSNFNDKYGVYEPVDPRRGLKDFTRKGDWKPFEHPWHLFKSLDDLPF